MPTKLELLFGQRQAAELNILKTNRREENKVRTYIFTENMHGTYNN